MLKKLLTTVVVGSILSVVSLQAQDFWDDGYFYTKTGKYYVFNKGKLSKNDFDFVEAYKVLEKTICSDKGMRKIVAKNNGSILLYIFKDGVKDIKIECK